MDCVSVRYQTVPVVLVLTCIPQCTVVNCLKLRRLIENKVFYPQGGCSGRKNVSFRHWRHLGNNPFPPRRGGGGSREVAVVLSYFHFSIISIGVRRGSFKTIKTGLKCWQYVILLFLIDFIVCYFFWFFCFVEKLGHKYEAPLHLYTLQLYRKDMQRIKEHIALIKRMKLFNLQ